MSKGVKQLKQEVLVFGDDELSVVEVVPESLSNKASLLFIGNVWYSPFTKKPNFPIPFAFKLDNKFVFKEFFQLGL